MSVVASPAIRPMPCPKFERACARYAWGSACSVGHPPKNSVCRLLVRMPDGSLRDFIAVWSGSVWCRGDERVSAADVVEWSLRGARHAMAGRKPKPKPKPKGVRR